MRSDPSRDTRRRLVVEFVGAPGAGKTTLAAATVAGLRRTGAAALTPTDAARPDAARTRVGRAVRDLAPPRLAGPLLWWLHLARGWVGRGHVARRQPRLVRHVLASQWRRPVPWRLRRHALGWWFAHAGRRVAVRTGARPGEVLVVDDGFLHRAATLHASEHQRPDPGAVRAYVDLLAPADLVVHVRVPPGTCARRVAARGAWAHRPLDDRRRVDHVRHAAAALDVAVGRARETGWAVLEVDNDAVAPTVAAERVVQHVFALVHDRSTDAGVVA